MLSAATVSSSLDAPPSVALGAINTSPVSAGARGVPSDEAQASPFAKVLSGNQENTAASTSRATHVQPRSSITQIVAKSSISARSKKDSVSAASQPSAIPAHGASDSVSQPGSAMNPAAAAPVPAAPVPLAPVPVVQTPADTAVSKLSADAANEARAVAEMVQSLALDVAASTNAGTSAASANVPAVANGASSVDSGITASDSDEADRAVSPLIPDQGETDQLADSFSSVLENMAASASGAGQQSSDATSTAPRPQAASSAPAANGPVAKQLTQQIAGPTTADPTAQEANLGGHIAQVTANPANEATAPQASDAAQAPATVNPPAGGAIQAPPLQTAKASSATQRSITQQIQPDVANLLGLPGTNAVAAANAAANNSAGNSTQNQSNGTGHSAGQSTAQVSVAQPHSSDNTKGTGNGEAQDGRSSAGQNSAAQISAATLAANQSALVTGANGQVSHASSQVATQIATQANATSATADVKGAPASAAGAQSLPMPTIVPASLPRSLDDVAQATQLYQRVGGAEMHIAMDTDSLGAIDLRAVVHQGSLSATIAVQRPDVQTLLVNELPALQHSLAEKNLQVNQISVLAGSIGNGTDMNGQQQQQQNRPTNTPMSAAMFGQSDGERAVSGVATVELAMTLGSSGRLSVLA